MMNLVEVEMVLGIEIHSEATIEGTAEEVWAVLSDFGAYGEWNLGIERVDGTAGVR